MGKNRILAAIVLLAFFVFFALLLVETGPVAPATTPAEKELNRVTEQRIETATQVTLAAVGDIMAHMPQVHGAYHPDKDTYDFTPAFAPVKEILSGADLAVANLETTLAGEDMVFSGYPRFNSPAELATALKWAGFDLVSTANNHSLDRGEAGVLRTLDNLAANGLKGIGTHRSWADREAPALVEKKGQKLSFLAYTYGTNGIPVPQGKEYLVNLIDETRMAQDIRAAREKGADWVVILLHFGNEYQRTPTAEQGKLVSFLFEKGADIVLGSHPHVLQPVEFYTSGNRDRVVAFSLGNFVSNQRRRYRDTGMILLLSLEKDFISGARRIRAVHYVPTWVHRFQEVGKMQYRIVPIQTALTEYHWRQNHNFTEADFHRMLEAWQETRNWVAGPGSGVHLLGIAGREDIRW